MAFVLQNKDYESLNNPLPPGHPLMSIGATMIVELYDDKIQPVTPNLNDVALASEYVSARVYQDDFGDYSLVFDFSGFIQASDRVASIRYGSMTYATFDYGDNAFNSVYDWDICKILTVNTELLSGNHPPVVVDIIKPCYDKKYSADASGLLT